MRSLTNKRRGFFYILLGIALVALMFGARGKMVGKKRVGFSQTETDGPWRIAETKSMQDEARKRGYDLVLTNARGDTAQQISDLENLIAQRVDVIFLAPREELGLAGPIREA